VSKRLAITDTVSVPLVLAAAHSVASPASATPLPTGLHCHVLQHAGTFDAVRRHLDTLRITHRQRFETVGSAARYRVVKRSAPFTVDRPAADAASAGEDRPQAYRL